MMLPSDYILRAQAVQRKQWEKEYPIASGRPNPPSVKDAAWRQQFDGHGVIVSPFFVDQGLDVL